MMGTNDKIKRYNDLLQIDRDALDEALIQQPGLFLEVSQRYAEAVSERDAYKDGVEVTRAKRSLAIRSELSSSGKVTEASVAAQIELDDDYREAVGVYLAAKARADKWMAVKEAFQQRAFVLKDLASLYIAGYFGSDSVGGKAGREVQERSYIEARDRLSKVRRRER
jgi:hypothetical protein